VFLLFSFAIHLLARPPIFLLRGKFDLIKTLADVLDPLDIELLSVSITGVSKLV